jgi:hypothetical protein
MRIEALGGESVLVVDEEAPAVAIANVVDAMTAAFDAGAQVIAVAVDRLDPAFFDLRTGVAGEIAQKLVNYRLRLAVVGELPAMALESRAFAAFVREGNRGSGPWFVATLAELGARLGSVPPRP